METKDNKMAHSLVQEQTNEAASQKDNSTTVETGIGIGRWRAAKIARNTSDSKQRRLSKKKNPQPGVEFVPWGPSGPPSRDIPVTRAVSTTPTPQLIQDSAHVDDIRSENDEKQISRRRVRRCLIGWTLLLVLLTAVLVGVGVKVSRKSNREPERYSLTVMDPPSVSCAFWFNHKQPNVVTQCTCTNTISIVADDVATQYYSLVSAGFLNDLDVPHFNKTIDSCDPTNQALVWLASGSGSGTPFADERKRQRYVLALLYAMWNGQFWKASHGWLSSDDECRWSGVSCNVNGEVVEIDLSTSKLNGKLGSAIGLLTSLTSLSLFQNSLQGDLPVEIGKLTNLASVRLFSNFLKGTIPTEMGKLTTLKHIQLDYNQLTGTLPTELGTLSLLEDFSISFNRITGCLPSEIGQFQKLSNIALSNNTLTGQVPTEIGFWKTTSMKLDYNSFNGPIPSEIGLITNLQGLSLTGAGFTGALPTEVFNLSHLHTLYLDQNSLSGTIPTLVGKLVELETLYMSYNQLTGTLPTEFGLCTSLTELALSNNQLNGTIPVQLGHDNFEILYFDQNPLVGPIPPSVCAITTKRCKFGGDVFISCNCCICLGSD